MKIVYFLIFFILKLNKSAVFNASCENDDYCKKLNNEKYFCINKKCQHETFSFNFKNVLGLVLIILISGICNSGGLGGGAVIIPIYSALYKYTTAESVPLSKATILAGAIMNYIIVVKKKNPDNLKESLINYKLASIIIPLLLGGTMIGVLLTKIFPPIITIILLTIHLIRTSKNMYKKAKTLHFKEKQIKINEIINEKKEKKKTPLGKKIVKDNSLESKNIIETQTNNTINLKNYTKGLEQKNTFQLLKENKRDIFFCIFSILVILFSSLSKGGHGFESLFKIKICSPHYWFIYLISQIIIFILSFFSYKKNKENILNNSNNCNINNSKLKRKFFIKINDFIIY